MSNKPVIRPTVREDIPAMLALYNDEILHGTATLNCTPQTLEQRFAWFEAHQSKRHISLSAELDGEFAGFASLSVFRTAQGYDPCVELSVYVTKNARGKGVGDTLMTSVIDYAKNCGAVNTVVSVITSENAPSIRLHEKHGFTRCGVIPHAAVKFGKPVDVMLYVLDVRA